jgi:hypothetical protein
MTTETKQFDELIRGNGLKIVRKLNICGYFEYHVLNKVNKTIAKHTVQKLAIHLALEKLKI